MPGKTLDFYWDLGSTNAYFALHLLKPIAARHGALIRWHPFNLGYVFRTNNYVLMDEPPEKIRNRKADLARWAKKYDLPFRFPSAFPIKTARALRGALAMRAHGLELPFMEAIFAAYWERDVTTIGEYETLRPIAAELGVDPDTFEAAAESDAIRQALIDETDQARARGVFGTPTIAIEDELYWGKDRMEFVEDHLTRLG